MKRTNLPVLFSVVGLLAVSGCWTLSETDYPEVAINRLPAGKTVLVSCDNFGGGPFKYVPVAGHEVMATNVDDRLDGPCQKEDLRSTNGMGLLALATSRLQSRVEAGLERKGYTIKHLNPKYAIALTFEGLSPRDYTVLKQLGLGLCTLFTMEKEVVSWKARLRIRDQQSRKIVFEREYEQEYEVSVWGPIPVASPACHPKITENAANCWALTALADRATADAAAFLQDKAQ